MTDACRHPSATPGGPRLEDGWLCRECKRRVVAGWVEETEDDREVARKQEESFLRIHEEYRAHK